MQKKITEKQIVIATLIGIGIIFTVLSFLSQGTYGGADDFHHYRMARYAFQYPHFFLDQWGKPVFTALSAVFAQFGFMGVKLYNLLVGIFTAWFVYLLSKKLNLANSAISIVFVLFSPIYTIMLFTGMTEITASLFIVVGIYLFFSQKYLLTAIIVSFLPFIRLEAGLITVLFFVAFLLKRKWWAIPLLGTATVFYTIVGWFYYRDILWVVHQIPYSSNSAGIYGSGELLAYLKDMKNTVGIPIAIVSFIGFCSSIYNLFTKSKTERESIGYELLLIFSSFFAVMGFHSVVWWQGNGALFMPRFIAAVSPLAAIYALRGVNFVEPFFGKFNILKYSIITVFLYVVVTVGFTRNKIPVPLGNDLKVIREAALWYKSSEYSKQVFHYCDPFFWFVLNANPHDTSVVREHVPVPKKPEVNVPVGDIVFWDAHYSANEGGLPLEKMLNNTYYQLIKVFRPEIPFQSMGGYTYEVYMFQRTNGLQNINNAEILRQINLKEVEGYKQKVIGYYDFEKPRENVDSSLINKVLHHNGAKSFTMNKEFSPSFEWKFLDISQTELARIRASVFVYPTKALTGKSLNLVVSVTHKGEIYIYKTSAIANSSLLNTWTSFSFDVILFDIKDQSDIVNVYLWNPDKNEMLVDDFVVEVLEKK